VVADQFLDDDHEGDGDVVGGDWSGVRVVDPAVAFLEEAQLLVGESFVGAVDNRGREGSPEALGEFDVAGVCVGALVEGDALR
jgi:hypothetical protein